MHRATSFLLLAVSLAHASGESQFGNDRVSVSVDENTMTWSAAWTGVEVSLKGVSFAVEVDGKTLKPSACEMRTLRKGDWTEVHQSWTNGVEISRILRVPAVPGGSSVTLSATIVNRTDRDVSLGTQHLIDVYGSWRVGAPNLNPASVYIAGASELQCLPADEVGERNYNSSSVLALFNPKPGAAFVAGFLTAREARPDVSALFRRGEGGVRLLAHQPFLGRKLRPGGSLDLDTVYLDSAPAGYTVLEKYGNAVASAAPEPVRTRATALWCSWYAHRMALSEDLVLSNAAAAARDFKPLGLEFMQLDHGWQRGDVTGDWVPNERFPHGLRWLADELKARHSLKLGLWIAPTDVAETSETFRKHRNWMLKDDRGEPLVNWKWYWKPNPNCYELNASNPEAAKWMEEVFAQLTSSGVSYYKIDFIAASAGEHFVQSNPEVTRGWGVLHKAIESVRRGAGPGAWIRYCQTPPTLSAGRADGTVGGTDTLDAGLNGNIEVLRANARSLAAGYWLNDRLYHREVCDMSVRMQADIEEARLRLAIMTLAGCSISFSDELQHLPPTRIRMMQTSLPPGNPPMKPLDLFERTIPSIWQIHCANEADEWDVVGLFNFEKEPQERSVDLRALGFTPEAEASVFEFWEQKFLGVQKGKISVKLPAQSNRILALRKLAPHPQVIGTDMHVLQGYHELTKMKWDQNSRTLSGECERMPGIAGQLVLYVPAQFTPHFDFPLGTNSAALTHVEDKIWVHELQFAKARA